MRDLVKSPRWVFAVRCLSCRHRGVIAEGDLVRFGVKPDAPVVQFVKRLRCRKCGSSSVMAQRTTGAPTCRVPVPNDSNLSIWSKLIS